MATENLTGFKNMLAGAAIARGDRVKLTAANTVQTAGLGEAAIGIAQDAIASGGYGTIALFAGRTFKMRAAGAIAAAALVYGRASGEVDDLSTSAGNAIGWANEAATAQGDFIEIIPRQSESA
ncbi:MAG: DUF2190 family protein [Planctomycetes bacterium]|nr:DUF2190 family protein [Planctomycetota bacterium]